ncbi:MAG TPA: glycine--tRNA ligase subunit beta [Bryobacteraceae bacterium]|jgi:glycyl-tRNA synthetase beta chain|nr:glycine--tRNA ligase subunit beta [Bryobacteraceae bacterium]
MNLLLEIGVEEIPDGMIADALRYLQEAITTVLKENRLWISGSVRADATPRRLVIRIAGIPERQGDHVQTVEGPARGAPEAAVAGFARKHGVTPDKLLTAQFGKLEKHYIVQTREGRATVDILAEALPQLVLKTPFPKTMYWAEKSTRFIRPVRWIAALLDNQVIPFEIAGVPSGNQSSGHRKLGASRFPVTYENFEEQLRANFVILSFDERRRRIRAVPTKYVCDNPLLDTLSNLTEWPTPITGTFDPEFLDLPKEVLMMVMRHHQKYFSVAKPDGSLDNKFVAVTNTDGDPEGLIRRGNERVLRARFNDARFFWNADQKRRLADRVNDLANVTFQARLGSYLDKTSRIILLVGELGGQHAARRAAALCKADLTTELVKEFTELQGVIGGLYARAQGEPEEVAAAIYDHYKPASMEDDIPSTPAGRILAVADKLDTLRGCFRVGLIPSGSKDPFALRRAAQGIVRILVEGKLRLPIQSLCEGNAQLEEFVRERVRYYFQEIRGFKYDEVNAVLVSGWDDLLDVDERLTALAAVRSTEDFEPLAASFKRIRNILKQAQFEGLGDGLREPLLELGPESELYEKFMTTREGCRLLPDYRSKLEGIATLRPQVDKFFDKILVNAPDPAVRRNRLTLLHTMLAEFSTIADFSEIVTNTKEETK